MFWALFEPGRNSIIPNIAKGDEVAVANALSGTTWSFNFAVGFSIEERPGRGRAEPRHNSFTVYLTS